MSTKLPADFPNDPVEDATRELLAETRTLVAVMSQAVKLLMEMRTERQPRQTNDGSKEMEAITALVSCGPNVSAIASRTGINRRTIQRKIKTNEWKKFATYFSKAEKEAATIRRGHRTTDGAVEAYDE